MAIPSMHGLHDAGENARKRYGTLIDVEENAEVSVLEIPAGEKISETIRVHFDQPATRLVVVVGRGARAVIVEEPTPPPLTPPPFGGEGDSMTHGVEIFLEDGASLEFISIQAIAPSASITIMQRASVGANASIHWKNVTLGGASVSHDLESSLAGKNAESSIDWMFYARHAETQKLRARNSFKAQYGEGEITMRGVAEEKAHVKCDGMIAIGAHGTHTDTYLTQEVLMLDPTSRVDAIPGLEIKTNDVKASHSATVSRVTDEDLFYFAARGIARAEARRMFVQGFLGDLVAAVHDERARAEIESLIEQKYSQVT